MAGSQNTLMDNMSQVYDENQGGGAMDPQHKNAKLEQSQLNMSQQAMYHSVNMSYQSAGPMVEAQGQAVKAAMPTLVCNECKVAPCVHFPGDPSAMKQQVTQQTAPSQMTSYMQQQTHQNQP